MKVYIAGKITGLEGYKEIFNKAEHSLRDIGHKVMNPSVLPDGFEHEEYMKICYSMIDACDTVCFLKNWKESKGALMEYEYAKENFKNLMFEET